MAVADAELLLRLACMSAPLFNKMQGVMLWEPVSFSRVSTEVNGEGVMLKGDLMRLINWCIKVDLQSVRSLRKLAIHQVWISVKSHSLDR